MLPADRFLPPAILLIEEDMSLLEGLARLLHGQGYRVLSAATAEEAHAVHAAYAGAIPLVIAAVNLGETRGPEVVAAIRIRRDPVAAIYLSGVDQGRGLDADELEPGDAFLRKPFSLHGLLAQVQSAMAMAGSRGVFALGTLFATMITTV